MNYAGETGQTEIKIFIKNDIKNDLFNFNFPNPLQSSSVVSVCDAWDRLVLL